MTRARRRRASILGLAAVLVALSACNTSIVGPLVPGPPAASTLFDDEFNGPALDNNAWVAMNRPGDSGNSEIQCYLPSNATVSGGSLVLTTRVDSSCPGFSYTSAMVQWKSFSFLYGKLEIRAREAGGQGTWPALWLLGTNCQQWNLIQDGPGCNWPGPGADEVDMTEIKFGNTTMVWQNLITLAGTQTCQPTVSDVSQNWHTYDLIWSPGSLTWQIDGSTTCVQTTNVPSHPMFLIMNTAVGGSGGGSVDPSTLPQTHAIDYVRVYPPS